MRDIAHKYMFVYNRNPVREVKSAFRTACKKAKIANLRFHDLRHCVTTNLRRAGVDTTRAMQIVGHTDQPGVFVPPTMLVLSSQAGWFRAQVAGPRDCYVDGPCCNESSNVPS